MRNRQGQLTGFSLFNLQGYTSLVHFIYSHYRSVPSATRGPVEHARSRTLAHALVRLARPPAILYPASAAAATVGFSEDEEMSGPSATSEQRSHQPKLALDNSITESVLDFITYFTCPRFPLGRFDFFIFYFFPLIAACTTFL